MDMNSIKINEEKIAFLLVPRAKILHTYKMNYSMLAIKCVKQSSLGTHTPIEVQKLLHQYKNITLNDLPEYLPPLRSVHHQIDLIPSSKPPNMLYYRMSPKEYKL